MQTTRVLVATCLILALMGAALAATTAGYLDTTFDGDGIVLTADPAPQAITSDDGYLAAASVAPAGGGNKQWVVYRYAADGSRVTSFGGSGTGSTTPLFGTGGQDDEARVVREAPDGRILVAGSRWTSSGKGRKLRYERDFAVACYDANGALDTDFGTGGYVQIDIGTGDRSLHMAITGTSSDYSIYVCGDTLVAETVSGGSGKKKKGGGSSTSTTTAVAILKLDRQGGLDPSFGDSDGILIDNVGAAVNDTPYGLLVDDSDRPVVSVFQNPAGAIAAGEAVVLLRYTADGAIDMTFADSGRMLADATIGISVDRLALDSDGTSLILGTRTSPVIARYDSAGDLDMVFDTSGLAADDELHGLHVESDGTVIATLWVGPWTDYAITVGRFLANGNPDTSFGPAADGIGEWTEVDTLDAPNTALVRSDGKIILVGHDPIGNQTIISRYTHQ